MVAIGSVLALSHNPMVAVLGFLGLRQVVVSKVLVQDAFQKAVSGLIVVITPVMVVALTSDAPKVNQQQILDTYVNKH